MGKQESSIYRVAVSDIEMMHYEYHQVHFHCQWAIKHFVNQEIVDQERLACFSEHYYFCHRVLKRLEEFLLREWFDDRKGVREVELDEEDVDFLKSSTLLNALAQVKAEFENNISFLVH